MELVRIRQNKDIIRLVCSDLKTYIGKLHELASVWNLEVFKHCLDPGSPTWYKLSEDFSGDGCCPHWSSGYVRRSDGSRGSE